MSSASSRLFSRLDFRVSLLARHTAGVLLTWRLRAPARARQEHCFCICFDSAFYFYGGSRQCHNSCRRGRLETSGIIATIDISIDASGAPNGEDRARNSVPRREMTMTPFTRGQHLMTLNSRYVRHLPASPRQEREREKAREICSIFVNITQHAWNFHRVYPSLFPSLFLFAVQREIMHITPYYQALS